MSDLDDYRQGWNDGKTDLLPEIITRDEHIGTLEKQIQSLTQERDAYKEVVESAKQWKEVMEHYGKGFPNWKAERKLIEALLQLDKTK